MTIGKISVPLKEALGYYNEGTTIPQATSTAGTNKLETGLTNGQIEVVVTAAAAVSIADTKIVTLTVTTSDTEGGTYTEVGSATATASGATVYAVEDVIASFLLPVTSDKLKEWTAVAVATDDAAATGTYNVAIRRIVG